MSIESNLTVLEYREWNLEENSIDYPFPLYVPQVKWNYFSEKLRPLNDEWAGRIWSSLFAGVGKPFHFTEAKGWVKKIYKTVLEAPPHLERGLTNEEALVTLLGWEKSAIAFVVYSKQRIYAGTWEDILDCYHRGWFQLDNMVLCSEASNNVALFWETPAPYFGKRGHHSLLKY